MAASRSTGFLLAFFVSGARFASGELGGAAPRSKTSRDSRPITTGRIWHLVRSLFILHPQLLLDPLHVLAHLGHFAERHQYAFLLSLGGGRAAEGALAGGDVA